MATSPQTPPEMQSPPPQPSHLGWVLLAHLGLVLLLHIGRVALFDDRTSIFLVLFLVAASDVLVFFFMLFTGQWRLGIGFIISAFLLFIIGFGDCLTHLNLGGMH